jgi:LacI family gluconate utilization system Gnt-I transcriptional repressor
LAEAILRAGYRHIGVLGTKMPLDFRARKRMEGFRARLAEAGVSIEDQEFYEGGSALLKGREMTEAILDRSPELDFLYYSNDMIGAGGLLCLLERGIDIPTRMGLAGFNRIELLDGLPRRLATMDACRREIGRRAASIVAQRRADPTLPGGERIELTPTLEPGDTLRAP